MATAAKKKKWSFTLIKSLVIIIIVGLPLYFGVEFVRHVRETVRREQCCNHQKQIVLAMQNYVNARSCFPPICVKNKEGKPLYSWRLMISPYFCESRFFKAFHLDEPWDSPHNKRLAEKNLEYYFHCPSCNDQRPGTTNYVLVTGPGTIWDSDEPRSFKDIPYPEQTLILIEVADSSIHWTEPKDLEIDAIDPSFLDEKGNFKTNHGGFVLGAFADGHVEAIPQEKVMEALQEWSQVEQEKRKTED
ncbi:MAG: DUF1559 domain-containing protein [Planctomycetia bacterium]|jgi:hypothetical protein